MIQSKIWRVFGQGQKPPHWQSEVLLLLLVSDKLTPTKIIVTELWPLSHFKYFWFSWFRFNWYKSKLFGSSLWPLSSAVFQKKVLQNWFEFVAFSFIIKVLWKSCTVHTSHSHIYKSTHTFKPIKLQTINSECPHPTNTCTVKTNYDGKIGKSFYLIFKHSHPNHHAPKINYLPNLILKKKILSDLFEYFLN